MASTTSLQVIDLKTLYQGTAGLQDVANQLQQSFKELGFAYIKNHGISQELITSMFQAAKDFHALPMTAKMAIKQNKMFKGYLPANASHILSSTQSAAYMPNLVEAFITLLAADNKNPDVVSGEYFSGSNQWPAEMPDLKQTMTHYARDMVQLSLRMMQAFAVAFNVSDDTIKSFLGDPSCFLRLHRYPSLINADKHHCGIAPHTDHGFLTFVTQDALGGLEIKNPQTGDWMPVPYIENTFVLNAGDMMHHLTNGEYASAIHRVKNMADKDRYSIPFFFEPNMYQVIEVLDCFKKNKSARFKPTVYGDYLTGRLKPNYKALQTK